MNWLWTWWNPTPHLDRWEAKSLSADVEKGPRPGDNRDNHECEVGVESPGEPVADGLHRRAAAAIFAFNVFPPDVMSAVLRRQPLQKGDTVGCRFHFLPGLDLFFASRVIEVFDGPAGGLWRTGFTYRTLPGHPELGEETFCVEKDMTTGRVTVALRSWSRPGTWLARLAAPLVRRLQLRGGRSALPHLQAQAHCPRDVVPRRDDAIGTPSGSGLPATTTSRSAK